MSTTYYVSTTGSDTNNGTSSLTPKLTITAAISAASNGDKIFLAAGTYNHTATLGVNKQLEIEGTGYDTIISFNATPVIGIQITSSNVSFKSLFVKIGPRNGARCITIGGSTTGNTISGITLDSLKISAEVSSTSSFSLYLQSSPNVTYRNNFLSNITINNCEIIKAVNGIKISDFTQVNGLTLSNSKIYDNTDYGMHITTPGTFVNTSDFNPEVKNVLIDNTEFYNNGPVSGDYLSGGLYVEKLFDSTIKNCKFTARTLNNGVKNHLCQLNIKRGDNNGRNITVQDCEFIGGTINSPATSNQSGGLNIKGRGEGASYSKDPGYVTTLVCKNNKFNNLGIGLRFENNIVNSNNVVFLENSIFTNNVVDISNWSTNTNFRVDATNSKFSSVSSGIYAISNDNITDEQRSGLLSKVSDQRTILKANTLYTNSSLTNSISNTINFALSGEVIYVAAGTYSESVSVNKSVILRGANKITTILKSPNNGTTATLQITDGAGSSTIKSLTIQGRVSTLSTSGNGNSNSEDSSILLFNTDTTNNPAIDYLTFEDLIISNASNGITFNNKHSNNILIKNVQIKNNEGTGIIVSSNTETLDGFTIEESTISDNNGAAISINPTGIYRPNQTNFSIKDTSILNNNRLTLNNSDDVSLFGFNGNLTIDNVSIISDHSTFKTSNGSSATMGGCGLVIYGRQESDGTRYPSGNLTIKNVTLSGNVIKSGVVIDRYSTLGDISINNFNIKDLIPNKAGQTWPLLSIGHSDSDKSFNIGNTKLTTLAVASSGDVDAVDADFYSMTSGVLINKGIPSKITYILEQIYDNLKDGLLGKVKILENVSVISQFYPPTLANLLNEISSKNNQQGDILTIVVLPGNYEISGLRDLPITTSFSLVEGSGQIILFSTNSYNFYTFNRQ